MEYSYIGLNDLPDEILMIIFQKLNNIDVLYSFHGINQRLNRIICDSIFTNRLTFINSLSKTFIDLLDSNTIRHKFCSQILPSIHNNIQCLDLESSSMKHVLYAANYPNLNSLGLYNVNEESVLSLSTDENLCEIFKNQITTLFITVYNNYDNYDDDDMLVSLIKICNNIFTVFTRLITFVLFDSCIKSVRFAFDYPLYPNFRSSTLLKLIISVRSFDDCLHLLDGRFDQLHTLYVDLAYICRPYEIENQGDLATLKCFSLSCNDVTDDYDKTILPLFYRMSNLEELDLCLKVHVENTHIDGNYLKTSIINQLPRLNQFGFYILSSMFNKNQANFMSREDMQRTFINFPNNNITYYGDYFPKRKRCQCHIYTYPYKMKYYSNITNNFPGGLFESVRVVSLFDEHPFEHEFLRRIVHSFPFMEVLSLTNHQSQNHKQPSESNNDNRNLSVIQYYSLYELHLIDVHDDYLEEFLLDTQTYLQNNLILYLNYESLKRVTHNFTRDATRFNCTRIKKLNLCNEKNRSISVQEYFSHAEICYPLVI
ncbi:unnamed protein product [Adineta steineri]|uniref:F-box domain-containing protein n=1 Tax=Adineta steineri TaxID=433720 RepID=A0A818W0Y3_9BILA|nr:unnamed protein product [Adineta steineri]CAF3718856.1 unnamed protein product [Adineta steineri]